MAAPNDDKTPTDDKKTGDTTTGDTTAGDTTSTNPPADPPKDSSSNDANNNSGDKSSDNQPGILERLRLLEQERNEYKQKAEAAEASLNTLTEKELQDKENFKELAEHRQKRIEVLETQQNNSIRRSAVRRSLINEGIQPQFIDDLVEGVDISTIEISDNGNVSGVEEAITAHKQKKAHLYQAFAVKGKDAGNDNTDTNPPDSTSVDIKNPNQDVDPKNVDVRDRNAFPKDKYQKYLRDTLQGIKQGKF